MQRLIISLTTMVCLLSSSGYAQPPSAKSPDATAQVRPLPPPTIAADTYSDTWVATDALGRKVPIFPEVSLPRADRTVGIFYFLWYGAHVRGGPLDVTKILAQDPEGIKKPNSILWGPPHVMHHWGESIFGYYLTDDAGVLRKHAQMLGDAGVDVVIFDVTNQVTYRDCYRTLLRVWSEMRRLGNRTPQVAFLTSFGDPEAAPTLLLPARLSNSPKRLDQ